MPYELLWIPETEDDLVELSASDRSLLRKQVPSQLVHQPNVETNHRAPVRQDQPWIAEFWKLRVGALRIYYVTEEQIVYILAVGKKQRNQIRVGKNLFDMPELIQFLNEIWLSL